MVRVTDFFTVYRRRVKDGLHLVNLIIHFLNLRRLPGMMVALVNDH